MKRYITKAVIFLAGFWVVYVAAFTLLYVVKINKEPISFRFSRYLGSKNGDHITRSFKDFAEDTRPLDAVVLGSSHGYRGYDPRIFEQAGYHVFNLGTNAQPASGSYNIAKYFLPAGKTKTVLFDVYISAKEGAASKEGNLALARSIPGLGAIVTAASNMGDIQGINIVLHRILADYLFHEAVSYDPKYFDTGASYAGNGFAETKSGVSGVLPIDKAVKTTDIRIDASERKHFEQCIALLQTRGFKVVLINHPAPSYNTGVSAEWLSTIQDVATAYHVPFLDYHAAPGFDDRIHFCDQNHLSQAGVEKFNALLIPALIRLGALPPRP